MVSGILSFIGLGFAAFSMFCTLGLFMAENSYHKQTRIELKNMYNKLFYFSSITTLVLVFLSYIFK